MPVKFQDYYKTLEVPRSASQEEISKAFRKLARKYHPDVNKSANAEDKFKEINEAHEVLSDPGTRSKYDALGANWKAGQEFQPPPDWEDIFSQFSSMGNGRSTKRTPRGGQESFQFHTGKSGGGGGFSDFFDLLFGGSSPFGAQMGEEAFGKRGAHPTEGESHNASLSISLEDTYHGAEKNLQLELGEADSHGVMRKRIKHYKVKIPAGTTEGKIIRLASQGGKSPSGGKAGDLLIKIHIEPHPKFKVDGHNLITTLALAPWEAALGAKIRVPTLDGGVTLTIPEGSQHGQRLRLREKGLTKGKGEGRGDLLVELKIAMPKKLTEKEREAFSKLAQAASFNPREGGN